MIIGALAVVLATDGPATWAQQSPAPPQEATTADREPVADPEGQRVLARVDQRPIRQAEVDRLLSRLWTDPPPFTPTNRRQALTALIDRRLALIQLQNQAGDQTQRAVDEAIDGWREALAAKGQSEAEFLAQTGLTLDALLEEIAWGVNWRLYLEHQLSPSRLRQFFEEHRREFDGTQLRVRQIQWNLEPTETQDKHDEVLDRLVEEARSVREQIDSGQLDFDTAAATHSKSPSARDGGRLGWIARDGPMHEAFTQAAFRLQAGELSPPVISPFGVHLILCEEVRRGDIAFEEADEAVRRAAERFLFRYLADQQRPHSQIEIMADMSVSLEETPERP